MFLRVLAKNSLIAWLLCYSALLIHVVSLHKLSVVATEFIFFPVLAGSAVGLFQYLVSDEDPDNVDRELQAYEDGSGVKLLFDGLMVTPVAVSLFVMLVSQLQGTYDNTGWWVVVIGLLAGGEAGRWLRIAQTDRNG